MSAPEAASEAGLSARYEQAIRGKLRSTFRGQSIVQVVRVLPPVDTGGEVEVLFLAGQSADDLEACTAYFRDGGDGGDEPIICSGW